MEAPYATNFAPQQGQGHLNPNTLSLRDKLILFGSLAVTVNGVVSVWYSNGNDQCMTGQVSGWLNIFMGMGTAFFESQLLRHERANAQSGQV
jgi:hypothetical protein